MYIISKNIAQTKSVGKAMCSVAGGGDIVLLKGELGVGKTTLVKGILEGSSITDYEASSPTFVLQNIYEGSDNKRVVHYDLYRTEDLMPDEHEDSLVVIEWGDKIENSIPYTCIVELDYLSLTCRVIKIEFLDNHKNELFRGQVMNAELFHEKNRSICA